MDQGLSRRRSRDNAQRYAERGATSTACNGRFGAESSSGREWGYHKTAFNVALIDGFNENLFIATTPVADGSLLAVLK